MSTPNRPCTAGVCPDAVGLTVRPRPGGGHDVVPVRRRPFDPPSPADVAGPITPHLAGDLIVLFFSGHSGRPW